MVSEQAIMRERVRASTGVRDLERLKRHSLFHLEAGETKKRKALHLPHSADVLIDGNSRQPQT